MHPPNVRSSEFVSMFVAMYNSLEGIMRGDGSPRGTLRGTVVDVNDPENRGRVKVVFDDHNPEVPQNPGATDRFSAIRPGEELNSHWLDFSPAFNGRQPKGLIGKRVNIVPTNGEYNSAVLQDVLYDPESLAQEIQNKLKMPNNSTMVRLPIYPAGSLPPASAENHGCTVIEEGGPMSSDWLCVCLQRQGSYYWVRHIDMAHGHSGQNDGMQPPDTSGDGEQPVNQQTIWDFTFPTTGGEMQKFSSYGTSPRANPYGGEAKWYEPPK